MRYSNKMAPGLVETPTSPADDGRATDIYKKDKLESGGSKEAFAQSSKSTNYDAEINGADGYGPATHVKYLPYWDDVKYPPYEPFTPIEHGKDADRSFPNLLAGAQVKDVTANIGAEV